MLVEIEGCCGDDGDVGRNSARRRKVCKPGGGSLAFMVGGCVVYSSYDGLETDQKIASSSAVPKLE